MESCFIVVCIALPLQYHLMSYTRNNATYDVSVTLPGNIQVLCKSLQLLGQLLHQKGTVQVSAVVALVCLTPTREFVRH